MESVSETDLRAAKAALRAEVLARRASHPDRVRASARIGERALGERAVNDAAVISCFVGVGTEVETDSLLRRFLGEGRVLVVPVVVPDAGLRMVRLDALEELVPAAFGLREPRPELWHDPERLLAPGAVSVVLTPGVAFDRQGGRLGYGKGYYDAFLTSTPAQRIALAFDCQLVPLVPTGPRDVPMHIVLTESERIVT